jgi:hypothetical protein
MLKEQGISCVFSADFHKVFLLDEENSHWFIVWVVKVPVLVWFLQQQAHLSEEGLVMQCGVLDLACDIHHVDLAMNDEEHSDRHLLSCDDAWRLVVFLEAKLNLLVCL